MISDNHLNLLTEKLPYLTMNGFFEYMGLTTAKNKNSAKEKFKHTVQNFSEKEIKELASFIIANKELTRLCSHNEIASVLTRRECIEIISTLLKERVTGCGNLSLRENLTNYEISVNIEEVFSDFCDLELQDIVEEYLEFAEYVYCPPRAMMHAFYNFIGLKFSESKKDNQLLISSNFNLDLLNISNQCPHKLIQKFKKVLAYIKSSGEKEFYNFSVMFVGNPGLGKTEFSKFLAKVLGGSLLQISFGSLSSGLHGETEANIKNLFEEGAKNNSVILIDECDSLFFDRAHAQQDFQVSIVNEMLNQIENYPGIVICSTNLIRKMDSASLRRFAMKITFNYLSEEQAQKAFEIYFKNSLSDLDKRKLNSIKDLSLGDFKVVRQQTFLEEEDLSNAQIIELLRHEVSYRDKIESASVNAR